MQLEEGLKETIDWYEANRSRQIPQAGANKELQKLSV
jgi:dTDP-D-glucose 4,6-dehydratase